VSVSRLEERRRRWEAEQEQRHTEDLAQAERIGADFGLGELRTTARYRQARSLRVFLTGLLTAIAGLVAGVLFGVADVSYSLAGALAAAAASAGPLLLGVQLMRTGLLADRIVAELVRAYGAGEPVVAGPWRIGQDGLSYVHGNGRAVLTPWGSVRAIEQRRDGEFTIRGPGRRRRAIALSGVPNGVFIARLIEHAAGQHELIRGRDGRTTDRSE
jgi:hypothetical protein